MSPLEQLLNQFQQDTGMSGNISFPHTFTFDKSLQVTCTETGSSIQFAGEVLNLNEITDGSSLLRSLLQLNLVRMYEQQAVLCLDQSSATIELFHKFNLTGADIELFSQYLEDFVNELEFWQENGRMLTQEEDLGQQGNYTFLVP